MADDTRIIELFFERSEQAIRELDIKYGKLCHQLAYNVLNNQLDAEECVNDAYLGAWNAIPPARPNPLRAYICKIVRNLSLKLYYKNEALKRNSAHDVALQELDPYLSASDMVELEVEGRELVHAIENFLDTLSEENCAIFMRRYWFSDTHAEIAKRVGISEKNVSVRLTRTRKELKQYLFERGVLS